MGKLIVLEGLDGSGKSTQLARLPDVLRARGIEAKTISFPDYDDPSSTLVKMYLAGDFGKEPGAVNAYAASIFYAADRYASFVRYWREAYEAGRVILAGRYISSNAIHQTAKLPRAEWAGYIDWLYALEVGKIGIPAPDLTLYLDMPVEVSERLLSGRYAGDEGKKDLHERDRDYQRTCREAAAFAAERLGWTTVSCARDGEPLPMEEITETLAQKIAAAVKE
ncbi:MAG: dTMP kinase [Candidatus Howiella sp.]|jgi:dTMP kinase